MANRADEHKMKKKGAQKSGGDARSSRRWGESGNVFFTLFGAVALVGVVGASTATLMRGPLGTVMNLNQKAKADTQMNIAARLAVMETSQLGDGGNCDADSYLEPLSPRAGGGPTGGGLIPSQISASQIDPWGTPYGYCAWDHGNETGCRSGLLAGKTTGTDGLAMVIVSAGPDRMFDTVCAADPNYVTKNGDDLVLEYTYSEAVANSDGLWKLMEDDPDTATIGNKNIKVSGSAEIGSGLNVQGGGQFGGGAFHFSDASDFYIPTVTTANQVCTARGSIRVFNGPASETVLQLCNGSVWLDVGGTEAKIAAGADGEVQFAVGSVLSSSPSFAWNNTTKRLEIAGDIQADNLTLGTPGVATVGSLAATDGTLEVTSNLDITGTGNLAVGGNTTVTGTTTLSGVTTVNNTLTVSSGNLTTLNGGVTVDSTATMNGTVLISNGTAGAPGLALISDTDTGLYAVTNGLGLSAGGSERLRVDNDGTTVTGLLTSDNLLVNTAIASSSFEIGTIGSGRGLYGEASDGIKLGTSGGQLVLEAGGDVGIGTNDPQARLDVRGSIASSDYVRIGRSEFPCTGSLAGALRYFDGDLLQVCSNDTGEWETIGTSGGGGGGSGSNWSKSGNHLFYNQTGGNVMIGTGTAVGGLKLLVNGNIGADNFCSADGDKCFTATEIADGVLTAPGDSGQVMYNNGGALAGSQLVWDNTNKRLGIGKASPASQLDVVGDIQYTGTITDVSDRRLKDDILPLNQNGDSMLRKLGMVDTYSFTMKDDPLKRVEFGVMAQEFEKIFPELVHTANDNMQTKSVNYMGMIAPMIAAMQELQTQNDQLRTELAAVAADRDEMRLALHQLGEDVRGLKAHTGYGIGKAQMSLWLVLAAAGGAGLVAFGAGFMRRGRKNAA